MHPELTSILGAAHQSDLRDEAARERLARAARGTVPSWPHRLGALTAGIVARFATARPRRRSGAVETRITPVEPCATC